MDKLRVLDLFSGIGGFSIGLEKTGGFETVGFVEINPFCQQVLKKHWEDVPIFKDITNESTSFDDTGPVDLVTAGFPCQDISSAGKRAGLAGSNSSLFWHVLRTVRMVGRPRIALENVAALLNRGMGTVLGAMATFGYDAEWHSVSAGSLGAPHWRDRVLILADPIWDEQPREEPCVGPFGRMGRIEQSMAWDRDWQDALSEFRRLDDGLPRSVASTDGYRNAIIPQKAELIGRAILEAMAEQQEDA